MQLVIWKHPAGEEFELRELREIPRRDVVFSATPIEGDRLDLFAERFYRDPMLFWRLADASEHLDPWDMVVAGEPVPVPPNKDK